MKTIRIWVYDGCLASAACGFLDVFATANAVWKGRHGDAKPLFVTRVESPDGSAAKTAAGISLPVDGRTTARGPADAVMLPGIFCGAGVGPLLSQLDGLRSLHAPLRQLQRAGALLAANCSASFLLGDAGLLDGRTATTTWWLANMFRERFPDCLFEPSAVLTDDGSVLCSGATTAYLDLALRVVLRLAGPSLAATCARLLLIDASRDSQAPYMTRTLQQAATHTDTLVSRAERWIQKRTGEAFSLKELARATGSSERTLIRRFKLALGTTPLGYAQGARMEAAKGLLMTTDLAVERIGDRVGYGDSSSFRRLFKREVGLTPRAYRERFRHGESRRPARGGG